MLFNLKQMNDPAEDVLDTLSHLWAINYFNKERKTFIAVVRFFAAPLIETDVVGTHVFVISQPYSNFWEFKLNFKTKLRCLRCRFYDFRLKAISGLL